MFSKAKPSIFDFKRSWDSICQILTLDQDGVSLLQLAISVYVVTLKTRTRSQRGCSIWWLMQDNYLHQVGKENLQGLPKEELPDTHTVGILGEIKVTVLVRLCVKLEQ